VVSVSDGGGVMSRILRLLRSMSDRDCWTKRDCGRLSGSVVSLGAGVACSTVFSGWVGSGGMAGGRIAGIVSSGIGV